MRVAGICAFFFVAAWSWGDAFSPNDPYYLYSTCPTNFPGQWHLYNSAPTNGISNAGVDAGLRSAWNQGYTGRGVVIGIVDDGTDRLNYDLVTNYNASLSYDFVAYTADPYVNLATNNNHGTAVAGVAAARGGNGVGGTGAAPYAQFADIRIGGVSNGTYQGYLDAYYWKSGINTNNNSISSAPQIQIQNHSYGSDDVYASDGSYDNHYLQAWALTSSNGVIHVFAAGNMRDSTNLYHAADCTKEIATASPDVISVAALGSDGKYASYSCYGASVFVTAPSSSDYCHQILTPDRTGLIGYNRTSDPSDTFSDLDYTSTFGGTSSAAPLVSGIIALGKEANPNLDVRSAKHALVRTSVVVDASDASATGSWNTNGVGFVFNPNYGFGNINAGTFVSKVMNIAYVTENTYATTGTQAVGQAIPDNDTAGITKTIGLGLFGSPTWQSLESVQVKLSLSHALRGDLEATMTSPSGMSSKVMTVDSYDKASTNGWSWTFLSNAFWGENPQATGNWTLKVADLVAGNTGTWDSYAVTFNMGAVGIVDAGDNTVNSNIQARTLTLNNSSATLTLPQTFTVRDNTLVMNGQLLVNGTLTETGSLGGLCTVQGGTLGGAGTIRATRGAVNSGGVVRPGSAPGSPGTLTLAVGNYTQGSGGTLEIQMASSSNYGKLAVAAGTAALDGCVRGTVVGGYKPAAGTTFAGVVTATSISGQFATVQHISPTLKLKPVYYAASVDLLVERDLANPDMNLNPTQLGVAQSLSSAPENGDLDTVLDAIGDLDATEQVEAAYDQLSPQSTAQFADVAFAGAGLQAGNLSARMESLRLAGSGFSGYADRGNASWNFDGALVADTGTDGETMKKAKKLAAKPEATSSETPWGFFANGQAIFGSQDTQPNLTGYDFTQAGTTMGVDYRFCENLAAGMSTGYNHTWTDLNSNFGHASVDTVCMGPYAMCKAGDFYANASANYGRNFFSMERNINFPGVNRTAKGNPEGNQFSGTVETGYDLKAGNFLTGPLASFQMSRLWIDRYTEDGADSLDLTVEEQEATSMQSGLGWRVLYQWRFRNVTLKPNLWASWQHEFDRNARQIISRIGEGGSFGATTASPQRDFMNLGAGMEAQLTETLSVNLNWATQAGDSHYMQNTISGGLRVQF